MQMGEMSRRNFLLGCTTAVAASAALPVVPPVRRYAIRTQLPEAAWRIPGMSQHVTQTLAYCCEDAPFEYAGFVPSYPVPGIPGARRYLWSDLWRAVAEDLMPRHVRAQGWMP